MSGGILTSSNPKYSTALKEDDQLAVLFFIVLHCTNILNLAQSAIAQQIGVDRSTVSRELPTKVQTVDKVKIVTGECPATIVENLF